MIWFGALDFLLHFKLINVHQLKVLCALHKMIVDILAKVDQSRTRLEPEGGGGSNRYGASFNSIRTTQCSSVSH